mmetsp:Transcript_33962/g.51238  ORF Transcript_33962/g.51238 Transcript_33962/m.51238 type:complete len:86 (-) Transcript_33962:557-814(-)
MDFVCSYIMGSNLVGHIKSIPSPGIITSSPTRSSSSVLSAMHGYIDLIQAIFFFLNKSKNSSFDTAHPLSVSSSKKMLSIFDLDI